MDINELFKKDKRESAVDIVVNNIKQLLIERKLKPGDRLPSELEISEGMGVIHCITPYLYLLYL